MRKFFLLVATVFCGAVVFAAPQIVTTSYTPLQCNGAVTTLTVTTSGIVGSLTYQLNSGAAQSSNLFTVSVGTYTVTVNDGTNNYSTTAVVAPNSSNFVVTSSVTNVQCNGGASGSLSATVSAPVLSIDGMLNEVGYGAALATKTGGPVPGFGAGHELNALYATSTATDLYLGIAGDVQNTNRIVVWIDCKAGGYNNGGYNHTGAPAGVSNFNSSTVFDFGFDADYALCIGTNGLHNDFFFDLFPLTAAGGGSVYLGNNTSTDLEGAPGASGSMTNGFEMKIPWTALGGKPTGSFKVFAMYMSDGGFLSNQFLYRAGPSDGNYGSGAVSFGAATPDPVIVNTYSEQWNTGATTSALTNLVAGTYTFTVSNSSGCTSTSVYQVSQPSAVTATATATAINCYSGSSSVTVTATGGTPSYNGTGAFSVGAGAYTYTVTDANNCTGSTILTITEPAQFLAIISVGSISCNAGSALVTAAGTGGTPPYAGTGSFNYSAGSYTVNVTDSKGCIDGQAITITEPSALVPNISTTPILCNSGSSTVLIGATGGTGTYSGIGSFNVNAGTYTFIVTDAASCSSAISTTITEPTLFYIDASQLTSIACNGGSAAVAVTGYDGTSPYSGVGNLSYAAGSYTISAADNNGCTATFPLVISQPNAIGVTATASSPILCFGNTTTVNVSAVGGTGTLTGTGLFYPGAGTYTYTVTDIANCSGSAVLLLTQPTALTIAASVTSPIICSGGTTQVSVSATGGTPPLIGDGIQPGLFSMGTYSFTVTDNYGCITTASINITEPPILTVSATVNNTPAPIGSALILTANSATATSYSWSLPGGGTSTANPYTTTMTNTSAGTYTISVMNVTGCSASATINVSAPQSVIIAIKVMLSGPYVGGALMADSLRSKGLVPLTEPYSTAPYAASFARVPAGSGESTTSAVLGVQGSNAIVDWVFVQLRSSASPSIVVASMPALLQRDGDIVDVDGVSALEFDAVPAGDYYVAVRHRNHLGIMTANPIALSSVVASCDMASVSGGQMLYSLPSSTNPAARVQGTVRTMFAGNCSTNGAESALLSYGNTSQTDKTRMQVALGTSTTGINGYSIFDCDMNGVARFNGLMPDRLVIFLNVSNSNTAIFKQQLP
jgi:hypothetical protein